MNFFKRYILEFAVFLCGGLVMVYEIIGSRILSPFIGASTYVWTSLIGIILAALSLGYWLGGRTADRKPHVKVLASMIFLAGGFVSATILLKDLILSAISAAAVPLELKSVIAALLLFAPASVALGFVTPYAVRLKILSIEDAGKTVGRLYALSTVGSIAGTFLAGFVFIPFVGSVRTLYIIAGSLILLSLLLAPFAFTRINFSIIVVFVLAMAGSEFTAYTLGQKNGFLDLDTEYNRMQIFETTDVKTGKPIRAMAIDPYFVQSAMFLDSDELVLEYSRFYHLIRFFKPDFQQTLAIGGAGYTFPSEYLRKYPQAGIDVVEIDPQMTEAARRYFRLQDDLRMRIFHQDGRVFLNQAPSEIYDVVLMDAFSSLFSVPYQLTTVEAIRQASRVLRNDGIVILNLGSAIKGEGSLMLRAEAATYRAVFPFVYVFKVRQDVPDEKLQNVIIVASKTATPEPLRSGDPAIESMLSHRYTETIPEDVPILTDDLAPVEYYSSIAQNLFLRERQSK